jgi:hypothetical protein
VSVPLVAKGQQLCLSGNAIPEYRLYLVPLLDAGVSSGNVDRGLCVMPVTPCGRENTGEPKMHYLSDVTNRRPMLRVTGEILLAFGCATPLVLLLSYLI